jgi:hypothetical protein
MTDTRYTITRVLVYEGTLEAITRAIEKRGVKGTVHWDTTIHEAPLGDLTPRPVRLTVPPDLERKAEAWDLLMELCGHWQDGSQQQVTLSQDDATRTCFIHTPKTSFFVDGQGFLAAIAALKAKGDSK